DVAKPTTRKRLWLDAKGAFFGCILKKWFAFNNISMPVSLHTKQYKTTFVQLGALFLTRFSHSDTMAIISFQTH
ncbi:hypothetical protein, partial [Paenibacillus alkalitolerans]|uniref:hypothetical protein n=1 Tax=Paenibacillus alkalitolerans TaxID=2799335 RepID=UPI001F39E28B